MKMLSAKLIAVLVAIYPLTIAVADENGATTDGVFAVHVCRDAHTPAGNDNEFQYSAGVGERDVDANDFSKWRKFRRRRF